MVPMKANPKNYIYWTYAKLLVPRMNQLERKRFYLKERYQSVHRKKKNCLQPRLFGLWTGRLCVSPVKLLALLSISSLFFVAVISSQVLAIARGYLTDDIGLQSGMVVALSTGNNSDPKVERATQENANRVVGIVTTIETSLITLSSGSAKVLVESEGQTEGYVSDMGGEISKGDPLSLSPLKGVLMKSGDTAASVIGLAADKPGISSEYTYQEGSQNKTTKISKIKINLNRPGGVNVDVAPSDSILSKIGRALTGREVAEARVLIALIIFVVVSLTEGGIIYGAISASITSLGRNPLAHKLIRGELIRVLGVALIVLLIGLAAVYFILWTG